MDTIQFADGSSLIMGGSRGGRGSGPPGKSPKYSFFSNTGPDPVENLKATHVPSQHYMTDHYRSISETIRDFNGHPGICDALKR